MVNELKQRNKKFFELLVKEYEYVLEAPQLNHFLTDVSK